MNEAPNTQPIPPSLLKLSKKALLTRDVLGRTILHLIILTNRYDLLKEILRNPDVKCLLALTDYESGWNCLHYVVFHKKITCFKVLLDHFKLICSKHNTLLLGSNSIFVELLKCKDRNHVTPFQLMNNDFKTFIWVPEHIKENNEIELTYRYISSSDDPIVRVPRNSWDTLRDGSEIYVLGSNNSNQFGLGNSSNKSTPTRISHEPFLACLESTKPEPVHQSPFDKLRKPKYKKVGVSKNHSVILTKEGTLFTCGKGSRGRLGHSNLRDLFKFEKVEIGKPVQDFAISNNHCVALTANNHVYTWGLNSFNQLGYESSTNSQNKSFLETFEATPSVAWGDLRSISGKILGLAVSRIHSLAYTDSEIFSWGLNIGQMGFSSYDKSISYKVDDFKGSIQPTPKSYQLRNENIKCVDTCEEATFIVTTRNEIHVLHQYTYFKLPKIPSRASTDKHFDKFKPTKLTEAITIRKLLANSTSSCILLLDNGDVMSFSFDISEYKTTKYTYVWKANGPEMLAIDFSCSNDGSIVICTVNGSVFIKSNQGTKQRANSFTELAMPTNATGKNKFKKIEGLNKVIHTSTDSNFSSFAFIRDDVDILSSKLAKNEFFNDIASLSEMGGYDFSRKQHQLLKSNISDPYITRFFPDKVSLDRDDELLERQEDLKAKGSVTDILRVKYLNKFHGTSSGTLDNVYGKIDPLKLKDIVHSFKYPDSLKLKFSKTTDENQLHDCHITIDGYPDFRIGVHRQLLMMRSKSLQKLFDHSQSNDLFVSGDLKAVYDAANSTLNFQCSIHFMSIIIFVYYSYSGETLSSLTGFGIEGYETSLVETIVREVENLKISFGIHDYYWSPQGIARLTSSFGNLIGDDSSDLLIKLKDGEIKCHSYILRARCAFFETLLSTRWENTELETVDFTEVSVATFQPVVQYIYGLNAEEVFDFGYAYDEIDLYINDLLDLIELSDELLLFQLKELAQIVICEFINLENVVILLAHSDYMSAGKLFMNCAWYMYNNLDLLIIDPAFNELSYDLLIKLEKQIVLFQSCKTIQFGSDFCTASTNDSKPNEWFENKSNQLIGEWFGDLIEFNDHFMSDRKGFLPFEPLVELKKSDKSLSAKEPTMRKNSRRSSTLNNDILAFRNSNTEKELPSNAIEEQDFEVVTRGRRKSKLKQPVAPPTPTSSITATPILPKVHSSVVNIPRKLSGTQDSLTSPAYPILAQSSSPPPINGLSPFSNWASKSSGNSILRDQPTLSNIEKKTKPKLGPIVKLSQKERKKILIQSSSVVDEGSQAAIAGAVETKFQNPWKVTTTNALNSEIDLPILGKRNGSTSSVVSTTNSSTISTGGRASSNSSSINLANTLTSRTVNGEYNAVYSTPSLTEIMIQESLLLEHAKAKEAEKKSFAEVQQEQEFAKWWEEETLRVQRSMASEGSSKSNAATKKAKPKSKPKQVKKNKDNENDKQKTGARPQGRSPKPHDKVDVSLN